MWKEEDGDQRREDSCPAIRGREGCRRDRDCEGDLARKEENWNMSATKVSRCGRQQGQRANGSMTGTRMVSLQGMDETASTTPGRCPR